MLEGGGMLGLVRTMSRIERQARADAQAAALAEREEQAALTAELQIVLREASRDARQHDDRRRQA